MGIKSNSPLYQLMVSQSTERFMNRGQVYTMVFYIRKIPDNTHHRIVTQIHICSSSLEQKCLSCEQPGFQLIVHQSESIINTWGYCKGT